MRRSCAFIAHIISFSGNDETEFSKKLNFVKPQLMAFARANYEIARKNNAGVEFETLSRVAAGCDSLDAAYGN